MTTLTANWRPAPAANPYTASDNHALWIVLLLPALSRFQVADAFSGISLDELVAGCLAALAMLRLPRRLFNGVLVLLLVVTTISIANGGAIVRFGTFIAQWINIFSYFMATLYALHRVKLNPHTIAHTFLQVFKWYLVFGYISQILFFVDRSLWNRLGELYSLPDTSANGLLGPRFNSFLPEPSHYLQFAFPAIVLFYLLPNRPARRVFWVAITGFSIALTNSALAVAGLLSILLAALLLSKNRIRMCSLGIGVAALAAVTPIASLIPSDVRVKIVDFRRAILADKIDITFNGSSRSLAHNFDVAVEAVRNTGGLGTGLGSYQYAFFEFSDVGQIDGIFFNSASGGSILIRVATELGLIGLGLAVFILIAKFPRRRDEPIIRALKVAAFVVLMIDAVRLGGYTLGITPFAFCLYLWASSWSGHHT